MRVTWGRMRDRDSSGGAAQENRNRRENHKKGATERKKGETRDREHGWINSKAELDMQRRR